MNVTSLLEKHEEIVKLLPWWKKDFYGYPIEVYRLHPIKSFYRLIAINLKKPFQKIYWWWRRRKGIGKFDAYVFPVIKNVDYQKPLEEVLVIQPMKELSETAFYMDFKYPNRDENDNPKDPETEKPPLSWNTSRY